MIKVYDYRCNNGHLFEVFTDEPTKPSRCGCGSNAKRVISPVHSHLEGWSGSFPTAASKWEREHERAKSREADEG